jgi:2-dehydro-3-deoxyphosphogluconate aldolase/(4S)-4-hydroxy-2-oxoglutarate aldolase
MDNQTMKYLLAEKIVSIVRGVPEQSMDAVVQALYEGGIRCVEFTFEYSNREKLSETLRVIKKVSGAYRGKMLVGAGTVLTPEEADDAVDAGAAYIVSPNTDTAVIRQTKNRGAVSVPGALTPSEITAAHRAGADIVKLFPAAAMGVEYIKSIRGPLAHIPIMATGGITVENISLFLHAGCVGLGIGGNLVNLAQIKAGNFAYIRQEAQKYVRAARQP